MTHTTLMMKPTHSMMIGILIHGNGNGSKTMVMMNNQNNTMRKIESLIMQTNLHRSKAIIMIILVLVVVVVLVMEMVSVL